MTERRQAVLDEVGLSWLQRGVWAICIAVYLTVFVSGIQAGGDELISMGRAVAFTLAAGVLGKLAVGIASRATLPREQGPSTDQLGTVGSLVDRVDSTNVAHQVDRAQTA
jgi:hypothetical protein